MRKWIIVILLSIVIDYNGTEIWSCDGDCDISEIEDVISQYQEEENET